MVLLRILWNERCFVKVIIAGSRDILGTRVIAEAVNASPTLLRGRGRKMNEILQIVATEYGVDIRLLSSPSRSKNISQARQVVYWILWRSGRTLIDCARAVGRTHHTTALYGIRQTEKRMAEQPGYADKMGRLRAIFESVDKMFPVEQSS